MNFWLCFISAPPTSSALAQNVTPSALEKTSRVRVVSWSKVLKALRPKSRIS
jgi:hypothetical protein